MTRPTDSNVGPTTGIESTPVSWSLSRRKKSNSPKHRSLFSQSSPKKKITVPFKLNKDKQLTRLKKSLNTVNELSVERFQFSKQRLSAIITNVNPILFKDFTQVASKVFGLGSNVPPKCEEHQSLPFSFSVQENWDENETPALVAQIFTVKQLVGRSLSKVGQVTLHYTKRTIQVHSSLKENTVLLLNYVMSPLIKITNMSGMINLQTIQCIDCVPQAYNISTLNAVDNLQRALTNGDNTSQISTTTSKADSPEINTNSKSNSHSTPSCSGKNSSSPHSDQVPISPQVAENRLIKEINNLCTRQDNLEKSLTETTSRVHTLECKNAEYAHKLSRSEECLSQLAEKISDISRDIENKTKSFNELRSTLSVKNKQPDQTSKISKLIGDLEELSSKVKNLEVVASSMTTAPPERNQDHVPASPPSPPPAVINDNNPSVAKTPRTRAAVADQTTKPLSPPQLSESSLTKGSQTYFAMSPQLEYRGESQSRQPPPPVRSRPAYSNQVSHGSVKLFGASNSGKISSALKNILPSITVHSSPGATFEHMAGQIEESQPCDILVLSGGVNDSNTLDNMELARQPLRRAIRAAKLKANKVLIMPPPPLNHPHIVENIKYITDMMWFEAMEAKVEYVEVAEHFNDNRLDGAYLFDRSGIHVSQLGGGLYTYALLDHLSIYHQNLKLNLPFCVRCQHTGHGFDSCVKRSQRPSHVPRPHVSRSHVRRSRFPRPQVSRPSTSVQLNPQPYSYITGGRYSPLINADFEYHQNYYQHTPYTM